MSEYGVITESPRNFSFSLDGESDIDAINGTKFVPVVFEPSTSASFHLAKNGVYGQAMTLWQSDARSGFISKPKLALDKMIIRFVLRGTMLRRDHEGDHAGSAGQAMLVAFDQMVSEQASSCFEEISGIVNHSTLFDHYAALEGENAPSFPQFVPVVDVSTASMRALTLNFKLVYKQLQAGLEDDDLIYPLLEEMLIYQLLATWPKVSAKDTPPLAPRPSWQVRRALEYIDANLQRRVTLAEIASACNVGARSLQISFRRELGKTPIQCILERRLDGVHKELLSNSDMSQSIASIAKRWGFAHVSDFSKRYRERYGSTPIKTRRYWRES